MRTGKLNKPRTSARLLLGILAGLILLGPAGCTRRFFRTKTDRDVEAILKDKDRYPDWKIENYHVYPDPRARFADATNPDRPPMPPDDPAAKESAPNPQKSRLRGVARIEGLGYVDLLAKWDEENRCLRGEISAKKTADGKDIRQASLRVGTQEQPEPLPAPKVLEYAKMVENAQLCEQRPFLIRLDQALELALINSREYQTRRENLYLAALPVSVERFAFAPQFFAFEEFIREQTGDQTSTGRSNTWKINSNAGVSKLFSTGALLLLSFANRTVIDLGGTLNRNVTSVSTLNLDLVQPLLRGGGRAVTLEPLTQAERNLLYEIRDYARFRELYYQYISGGGDLPGGLVFFGGGSATRPGSTRLNSGNPASPTILPGASGSIDLSAETTAPSEGYFPTLLKAAQLENSKKNVITLAKFLEMFRAYEEGGEVRSLQVGTVELDLLQGRRTVLLDEQTLRTALDNFKFQLGLPMPVDIELDDQPILPIKDQLQRFEKVLSQAEAVALEMDKSDTMDQAPMLRDRIRLLLTQSDLVRGTVVFQKEFPARWEAWEKLANEELDKKLTQFRTQRRKLLDLKSELEVKEKKLNVQDEVELMGLEAALPYGEMELALRRYQALPWKNAKGNEQRTLHAMLFAQVRKSFDDIVAEATLERLALVRPQWPALAPVEVAGCDLLQGDLDKAYEIATQIAYANRLDLMNARAQVVDSWRQIAIFANSLLGTFDVGYHMDSQTPPGLAQPLAFSSSRTRHQLVMNFEVPLIRLLERNNYRAALIAYQRARRGLQQVEDVIAAQVRVDVRNLRVLAESYRINQREVELAYTQVESSLEEFRAPQAIGGQGGGNIVANTQQLLNAQRNLPRVQNSLYTTWTNYLVARQQLFLDIDVMPLDYRGVWIDEYTYNLSQPRCISSGAGQCVSGQCPPQRTGAELNTRARLLPPPESLPAPVP